ncbi:MAG: helix-turn-helix domain-containing protein [Planctomycetales bacterium]
MTAELTTVGTPADLLAENRALHARLAARLRRDLPGRSDAARGLREQVLAAAGDDRPVLLIAVPGCRDERVARCLHDFGPQPGAAFDTLCGASQSSQSLQTRFVTCGLLAGCPDEIDSAWRSGGTLFLERLGSLALPLQKLLADTLDRRRRAEPSWRKPVRLVASLESDVRGLLGSGALRHDLFDAISAITLTLPALRGRPEDVGELAQRVLEQWPADSARSPCSLSAEALELLERHDWPGDVGELEYVLASALATDAARPLSAESLRPWLSCDAGRTARRARSSNTVSPPLPTLREIERRLIEATFARCDGNRERTARCLGIGIRTLSGKLREYGYPPRGGPASSRSPHGWRRAG